jgi:chromosome segregation ATPase
MQELSTLIDEHEKLLHDHQTLKEASFSQITESGGKIATLEQILSKEREKVSNLQSAMKSTKDASAQEVAGAREEAQRTVQAADGLRSDHDKLKREYKRVRSERERFKKTASEMAGHVNTLKSTLEEVRTVLQAKSQNEIKMQARIAMLETQSNKSQMMNITKEGSSLDKKISESLERGFASIDDYVKQTEDHGRIATRIGSEAQHPAVSPTRAAAELRAQELYHECQALKVKLETSQVSYSELMKAVSNK